MGILEFLTGRSAEEEHFYSDENAVNAVKEQLEGIKTTSIANARDAVILSIENLNTLLNGYVEPLDTSTVAESFNTISDQITSVSEKMSQTAADIKAYSEAGWGTKAFATLGMVVAKPVEGFLSVFEALGDGALSAVGFVSGAIPFVGKDIQNGIGKVIDANWSHDIFQYDKWAKYSAITEDSAIGNGLKIVGKVGGFVAASCLAAGLLGLSTTATYGAGLLQASGTTISGSAVAGLSGMGEGTEAALQQGKDYNDAFAHGLGQGIKQGAFAFATGVAMEKIAGALSKGTKAATNSADDVAKTAADSADDVARTAKGPNYEQLARDHGFYTADGTKVEVEISPDGTIPDTTLKHHFFEGDGITKAKGVRGSHTTDSFAKTFADSEYTMSDCVTSTRKTSEGIIEYQYRLPAKDRTGSIIPGQYSAKVFEPKTVFDSTRYSDDEVMKIVREAIDDFLEHQDITVIPGRANYPFKCYSKSGIPFSGYISSTTGEITTIYPDLRLPHSLHFI